LALVTVFCICIACAPAAKTGSSDSAATNTTPVPATSSPQSTTKKTTPAATVAAPKANLPVINNFSVDPAIISEGDLSSLKWEISNATSVSISPTVGAVDATGTKRISPETSTAYTLTASNSNGAVTAVATVMVEKRYSSLLPAVLSFTVNPRTISENDTCTISWNVYGASTITLAEGSGKTATTISSRLTPTGRMTVLPKYALTETQSRANAATPIIVTASTYTLTATNVSGTTTVTVDVTVMRNAIIPKPGIPIAYDNMTVLAATVLPMISWFASEPFTIIQGNSTQLGWEVHQATKVILNGAEVSPFGSQIISPAGASSYTLTASNQYYSVVKVVTVGVLGYKPEWFKPVVK
jgi:hypothetical protein